jgi:hypothetical protein
MNTPNIISTQFVPKIPFLSQVILSEAELEGSE